MRLNNSARWLPLCVLLVLPTRTAAQTADRYGDPLPAGVMARLGTERLRHAGHVMSMAFSPDGRLLASLGRDAVVRVWDVATGKQVQRFAGKLAVRQEIAFRSDNKTIVARDDDGILHAWNCTTGEEIWIQRLPGDAGEAALSPAGDFLAKHWDNQTVSVWEIATGKEVMRVPGPAFGKIDGLGRCSLKFSATQKRLIVTQEVDGLAHGHIWEVPSGKQLVAGQLPAAYVLAVSPDERYIALGNGDIVDAATLKEVRRVAVAAQFNKAVAFAPVRSVMAVANGKFVDLIDTTTRNLIRRLPDSNPWHATLAFSPDGATLAVAGTDNSIRLWNVAPGEDRLRTPTTNGHVEAAAFDPNGRMVVTAATDGSVRLWSAQDGRQLRCLIQQPVPIQGRFAAVAAPTLTFVDGDKRIAAAWGSGLFVLWDTATGKELRRVPGRHVMEREADGVLVVTGEGIVEERLATFSPDGQEMLTASQDGSAHVEHVTTGRVGRRVLQAGKGLQRTADAVAERESAFTAVALAPDGRMVATGEGGTVRLWKDAVGMPVTSAKPTVRVWETASGQARCTIEIQSPHVHELQNDDVCVAALHFTPDGARLVIGVASHVVLWDLKSNREQRRFPAGAPMDRPAVAVSPDGRLLAVGGDKNSARATIIATAGYLALYELESGEEVARLDSPHGAIRALAFSPDGKLLLTGGSDTTALLWNVELLIHQARGRRAQRARPTLETHWTNLAAADAETAYRALQEMVATPQQTIELLRKHLRPAPPVDANQLTRALTEVGDERFPARQKASAELEKLGDLAEPALQRALDGTPALELRRRVEQILAKINAPIADADTLRKLRAVELLERLGTRQACQLLTELTRGAAEARITREAQASLQRLTRKGLTP
jgi:WD40 repeat protein